MKKAKVSCELKRIGNDGFRAHIQAMGPGVMYNGPMLYIVEDDDLRAGLAAIFEEFAAEADGMEIGNEQETERYIQLASNAFGSAMRLMAKAAANAAVKDEPPTETEAEAAG